MLVIVVLSVVTVFFLFSFHLFHRELFLFGAKFKMKKCFFIVLFHVSAFHLIHFLVHKQGR